ncbi:helix-turn-helix domain-containing protein [Actinacidiphila glaucinigra]|uniref:helix-turn-helix domain-containing protein n=1 Tax=Actinacidiphila glaucinigra TaxID=235986 RepID=UPI00371E37A2
MSHTKIHHAFTKPVLPSWGVIDVVVEQLAKRARPRLVPEAEVNRFKTLWDAAHDETGAPGAEPEDENFRRALAEDSRLKVEAEPQAIGSVEDHVISAPLPVAQASDSEVERWLRVAAQAGNAEAMHHLGRRLEEQGSDPEAEHWYRTAAHAGDVLAMTDLGNLLVRNGDPIEGAKWHDRSRVSFGDLAKYLAEALDEWSQEVRNAHMEQGLSQHGLAKRLGIHQTTLSRMTSGRRVVFMSMTIMVDKWTQDVIQAMHLRPDEPSDKALISRLTQLADRVVAAREQLEKQGGRSWRLQAAEHLKST